MMARERKRERECVCVWNDLLDSCQQIRRSQPLRTAPNRHQPPTANRQPPTAANRHPLFNTASVVLCLAHVLTMKQRASP